MSICKPFIREFTEALPDLREVTVMLTLEINGQFVTWPEEFAELMMKSYRDNGIRFVVHRDYVKTGNKSTEEDIPLDRVPCPADAK